jgi:phosphate-selective porin
MSAPRRRSRPGLLRKTRFDLPAGLGVVVLAGVGYLFSASLALAAEPTSTRSSPTLELGGRVSTDYIHEVIRGDAAEFRGESLDVTTLRVGVSGALAPRMEYSVTANFAESTVNWAEVSVTTRFSESAELTVGNTKTTSLGNLASGRATMFIERGAFNDVLGLGRQLAAHARVRGSNWSVSAAVLDDTLNQIDRGERGFSARAIIAPVNRPGYVAHLGAWTRGRKRDDAFGYGFKTAFDADVRTSGSGFRALEDTAVALEGALIRGPFSAQGEFAHVEAKGGAGRGHALRTWYAAAAWLVTGGARTYEPDVGRIGLDPRGGGRLGVVEVAARYDRVDLGAMAGGGGYSTWTMAATWYPRPWMRIAANYTLLDDDDPRRRADADLRKLQLRVQLDF